jgi:hypothetical protein
LLLNDNQFAGEIPESICDLTVNFTDNHFDISHNSLCPPYPSCLENIYPGTQPGCYGSISVNVSFSGTWPDSGVVLMSLDTSYPSQGPPAASSNVTNDDLSNGIYNHTFTSLPFRTYEAILITYWPDGYTPAGTYLLIGSHLDIIYLFVDNYQVTIDAIFPE